MRFLSFPKLYTKTIRESFMQKKWEILSEAMQTETYTAMRTAGTADPLPVGFQTAEPRPYAGTPI